MSVLECVIMMKEESEQTWRNSGLQLTVSLLRLPVQGHARAMAPAGDVGGGGGGPAKTAGTGRRAGEEAGRPDPQVGCRRHMTSVIPLRHHSFHL